MGGKQEIGSRRSVIEIGNSIGITIPSDDLEDHNLSKEKIMGLDLPTTVDDEGVMHVDLSAAHAEIEIYEGLS